MAPVSTVLATEGCGDCWPLRETANSGSSHSHFMRARCDMVVWLLAVVLRNSHLAHRSSSAIVALPPYGAYGLPPIATTSSDSFAPST